MSFNYGLWMNKRYVTTGSGELEDYSCCRDAVQLQDYISPRDAVKLQGRNCRRDAVQL